LPAAIRLELNTIGGHICCLLLIEESEMRGAATVPNALTDCAEDQSLERTSEISENGKTANPDRQRSSAEGDAPFQDSLEDICAGLIHLDLCWLAPYEWDVGTYGYCLECGARIATARLSRHTVVFCLGCRQATERRILFSAVHGS